MPHAALIRRMLRRVALLAMVVGAALLALRLWPHASLYDRIPVSTAIWSADGELLRATLADDGQFRLWTPLAEISPDLTGAILLKEDRWFYWHPGVNPFALVRAGVRTFRGQGRQGGSTVTMQLARLLYQMQTRTVSGKLRQIGAALWLETRYSKRELLEAYLNLVPFGGNVQGVEAASRVYFGKPARQLNLSEALTLAVIPQRPTGRAGPDADAADLLAARHRLGKLWLQSRQLSQTYAAERRLVNLPLKITNAEEHFRLPFEAPHFVDELLLSRRAGAGNVAAPLRGRISTTLDSQLQRLVEQQITRYLVQVHDRGIHNATALLVDNRDMGVRAAVGSADYWNEEIDGQVNGVLAKRSPGSTLKPFIYALALDQGILHPQTMLRDAPTSFGPFSPENFDGRFWGPVSAQEALIRSRNVPAVWVSSQLHQPSLYQFLQSAGVSRLMPESYYGLALALGGGELSMEELAGLYAMLANGGLLRPLRVEQQSESAKGVRLLSEEASFITLEMLSENPRPDDSGAGESLSRWPVAWKTGTSWGFRDAWAAGVVGPYVLVVWIGNFQGDGNPAFVGVDAAAPLFFRISDALQFARAEEPVPPRVPPQGVRRIAVCAASGDLPNADCPQVVETWYIPGKSPIRVSRLHRAVAIDARSGRPLCPPYPTGDIQFRVFEFWPSDMLELFRRAGMPRRVPPSLPSCAAEDASDGPRIASPLRNVVYTLHAGASRETIRLEAGVSTEVRAVYWFDGSSLIDRVPASRQALDWRPATEGVHLIRAIDDFGRISERDVQVRFLQ
jgi:penicillin-binding protein 1C